MSGTVAGGKAAAIAIKEKYGKEFYREAGRIGGQKSKTGGFAYAKAHYSEDDPRHPSNAGYRGGKISRRGKK